MKLFAVLALFLGVSLVAAPAPESKWSFGLHGTVNSPSSYTLRHLTSDDVALGGGASVTYSLSKRQAVRLRTDYMAWPTSFTSAPGYTSPALAQKGRLWTGEADYLFFLTKKWHVQAGYGVAQWQNSYANYSARTFGTKNYLLDADLKQPLVTVGTGYALPVRALGMKSVSFELRYLSTQLAGSPKANSVQTGIALNF